MIDPKSLRNCDCHETQKVERNGHTASCNFNHRKAERQKSKPVKERKPIAKVGKNNLSKCSDGSRVAQVTINSMRSICYDQMQSYGHTFNCEGCGVSLYEPSHAHIIPQARCKQLGKTELIWNPENIFFACHTCNAIAENVSSPAITKLRNYPRIKAFLELYDFQRFTKLPDYSIANEPHIL